MYNIFCELIIASVICGVFAQVEPGLTNHKVRPLDQRPLVDKNVQQFMKDMNMADRTIRSTPGCLQMNTNSTVQVSYGNNVTVTCSCEIPSGGSLAWADQNCFEVTSQQGHVTIDDVRLVISNYSAMDPIQLECRVVNDANELQCYDRIHVSATSKEPVPQNGGVTGVVVCIILAVIIVMSLCFARKYKTRISLCMRDTFKANNGNDGRTYDAYVSTGVSETDRKFVNGFVNGILRQRCGYNLLVDDRNLLPRLDYSDQLQVNLHKCRRLLVIFSPSYMTHDWCMYCFNEGLRKLIDLHVPMIFVITDHTILSELQVHAELISHVPQILLTEYQTTRERQHAIETIRQKMPPPMRSVAFRKQDGMRSPMLSDAESIHKSDVNFNSNGAILREGDENGREYTFGPPPDVGADAMEYDEVPQEPEGPDEFVTAVQTGEDIDPNKVKVHQYDPRKDFYSLTMSDEDM